ncbi:neutral zinc metallopeptidase [Streptomyces sp. NPDC054945]
MLTLLSRVAAMGIAVVAALTLETSGVSAVADLRSATSLRASSDSDGPRLCSLSDIEPDGSCSGPQRVGIGSIGPITTQADIPTFTGRPDTATMQGHLTAVLNNLANFWSSTYRASDIRGIDGDPADSSAIFILIEPGRTAPGCGGGTTDASTLSYCPEDDTIRLSIQAILADWQGQQLPGETTPHAVTGEWSAIYSVAHEYAHNVQQELGVWSEMTTRQKELEADCLAGVYMKGSLDLTIDIRRQEFINVVENAQLSGDFVIDDPQHHGTPQERVSAVVLGLTTADPTLCQKSYEATP